MARRVAVAAVIAGAATLAGCSTDTSNRRGVEVDGPLMRWTEPASPAAGGNDAAISGQLILDDGCLFVGQGLVVWPGGTTWDDARQMVVVPSGDEIGLGDDVWGGGGYGQIDAGNDGALALIERCDNTGDGEVAQVNNLPDAIGPGTEP